MAQTNFTPISLYFSTTAAAVPSAGNLVNGELAINITDGRLYYKDNAGVVKVIAGAGGSGVAGGSNTQVQFNSSGSLAGSANLTFNGTTLTATGFAGPLNGTVGATTANTGAFTTLGATGVATFSAGTVSAPAITTTGDTNTGIFFPAADTIAFTEGGAESMRIDSSGNVGIGITNPDVPLNVLCNSSADGLTLRGRSSDNISRITFKNNANSSTYGRLDVRSDLFIVNAVANIPLLFNTNDTERMRIDSSGNVLVGTTTANKKVTVYSPQSGLRLNHDFTGGVSYSELSFSSSGVVGNGASIRSYRASESFNGNEGDLRFFTNTGSGGASSDGSEAMRIDSSGNVNIGTNAGALRGGGTLNLINNSAGQIAYRNDTQTAGRYWYSGVESSNDVFFVYPGTVSGGVYLTYGATSWTGNSDERLKNITNEIQNGIEKVCTLRAVNFTWKLDENKKPQVGLIAQDVQKVLPEAVDKKDDEIGTLGVRYTEVIPLLVASIKELKATIDTQAARIAALESK